MPYKDIRKQREYQNRRLQQKRAEWITENGPCKNCGSNETLEVDHVVSEEKEIHTRHLWSLKDETRFKELAKCQVLCKACHREKSNKEISKPITHGTLG